MKKKQLIIVKGNFSLRNALVEDLKEAGLEDKLSPAFKPYDKSKAEYIVTYHKDDEIWTANEQYIRSDISSKDSITYQLPEDYNKALQAFKDFFQEGVSFGVGDIVVFDPEAAKKNGHTSAVWDRPYILRVSKIDIDGELRFTAEELIAAGYEGNIFSTGGRTAANNKEYFRKATPEEVVKHKEQTLIYEAKKRGFVEGAVVIQSHQGLSLPNSPIRKNPEYRYNSKYNSLYIDGNNVYCGDKSGDKWAEIVKETTLTLGSKDVLVTIKKDGIYALGEKIDPVRLAEFYSKIMSGQSVGSVLASIVDMQTRFIRIGCHTEDHRFSLEEIRSVIKQYNELQ